MKMNIVVEGGEVFALFEGQRIPCELDGASSELSDGVYELSVVAPISTEKHDSPKTFNINFNMAFGSLAPKSDYHPPIPVRVHKEIEPFPFPTGNVYLYDPREEERKITERHLTPNFNPPSLPSYFDSIEEQIKENPEFEAMIKDLVESIKADHFNYLQYLPKGVQVSVEELTEKYNGHQLPYPYSKFAVSTLTEVIRNQKDPS